MKEHWASLGVLGRLSRRPLAWITGVLLATSTVQAADTLVYTIGKLHHFFQWDAGNPVEDPLNPWEAGVAVYPAVVSPNSVLSAAFWPAGGPTNALPFRTYRYEYQAYYTSQAALDAANPNATYTVQINARNDGVFLCSLALTGNTYPNAPRMTNYAAAQVVDATQPFTLGWDAFASGTTNDFILLQVASAPNETPTNYFTTPLPGQAGAIVGTNRGVVIPANTLPAGKQLFAKLSFLKTAQTNLTAYPGVPGYAGYGGTTIMPLQTLSRLGLPQISECPLSRTGAVGSAVTFSVVADGGSLLYQWKKDGVNLPGQTNDLLILGGVTLADQGAYTVGVSNSFGGVLSCAATLYVVDRTAGQRDPQMNPVICPNNMVNVVRQQRDGKLLLGGPFTSVGLNASAGITRYRVDGSWDAGFKVANALQGAQVQALEVQVDGKIVIGGTFTSYGGIPRLNVARLLSDGSLDLSFNPGSGVNGWVYAIALQSDGKVLIGGNFSTVSGTSRPYIARLSTNGTLDAAFSPAASANDRVTAIAVQPDGKILAGGWFTSFGGQPRNRLVRLESTGALDATFNIGTGFDGPVNSILVQPDSRILVGGSFNTNNGAVQRKIVRLLSDGSVDPSFNAGLGLRTAYSPNLGSVNSIALQPDGKVVATGEFDFYDNVYRANLARVLPNGQLDTNFTAGVGVYATSVIAPPDGSIAVAGNFSSYGSCYFVKLLANTGLSAPVITLEPANQTNLFGSTTTFTVSALGSGLTYQWQKDGTAIPGATNSSFVIPYTLDTDAGTYRVLVQNTVGSVLSDPAVLSVTVTPDFHWTRRAGATGNSGARGVIADAYGNTYVSGFYSGTLTLGTNVLVSAGGQDIFLARFDSAGNPVWARSAGGALTDMGWAVATDPAGNVVIAGSIRTNAVFSGITVTNAGSYDPVLAKYDPAGNLLWVRSAAGSANDQGYGVATDAAGNVYTCGFYNGPLSFDGTVISGGGSYLAKYSPAGTLAWVKPVPATACCNSGRALAYDPAGFIYMAGILGGTATFDTTSLTSYGGNDFVLAKYDLNGNLVWVRQGGGPGSEDAYGVAVGPDGSVTATGYFVGTANFGGTSISAPTAAAAMFVVNYSPAGQLNWVRSAGGNGDVAGYGVSVDRSGVAWVTGEFTGTAGFGPLNVTSAGAVGQGDIFVARYGALGNLLSVYQAGGTNYDIGFAVSTDAGGTAYVAGSFHGVASFGSGSLTNLSGFDDIFLARIAPGVARPALLSAPTPATPGSLTLSWGIGSADWVLTYTPTLGASPSVLDSARTTNNGIVSVTVPTSGSSGFYQLRAP